MGILARMLRRKPAPFHLDWLQIEISALCNCSCPYCAVTCLGGQREAGLMDLRTFERLRPSFSSVDLVYLQGWGEPLLHPQFQEVIRQAKAAGAMTGFTTNATLLDRSCARRLIESGVDIVAVTLAGAAAATHERFRPGCSLAGIDEAIGTLNELKRQRGVRHPRVHIAFLLARSNWQEVGGVVDLAARWGAAQVVVSNLTWIGDESLQVESILTNPDLWPEVTLALEQARQEASERGIELCYRGSGAGQPCATCPENILRACFVSHRGDVSPCVFTSLGPPSGEPAIHYYAGRAYNMKRLVFGNVCDGTLPAIWNSKPARRFRRSFQNRLAMASPGLTPEERLSQREHSRAVSRAIANLPARHRAAVLLRHEEGMSYDEIGALLGVSAKAVDSLLQRARQSLRDLLTDLR